MMNYTLAAMLACRVMARIRTRWNDRQRVRSPEEIASALGVAVWKLAGDAVVTLENEDFAIETYVQRLDVIAEFCAFQLHIVDRMLHAQRADDERELFVSVLAKHLADTMQDNRSFGNHVASVVGEHNRKWIADFVMDVQAPTVLATLRRALPSLFDS